jgi:ubiquinone/menaquinone biosynthesis C-methylase UbiE
VTDSCERARPLLRAGLRDSAPIRDGYLDALGRDLDQPGLVGALMQAGPVSHVYERWWRPALGRIAKGVGGPGMSDEKRIARLLMGLGPGDGVLDVACGPGNFSRDFARTVGADGLVVGVDASRPMLARAVRETRAAGMDNLCFVFGDAAALPFRDASFDAACCFAALNLFPTPFRALDEMQRVLAPGGRIALFTSSHGRTAALRLLEQTVAAPAGIRMFGRHELVDALRERGFTDVRQRLAGLTQFVGGRLPEAPGFDKTAAFGP